MKRIAAFVLMLILTFSLCACKDNKIPPEPIEDTTNSTIKTTVNDVPTEDAATTTPSPNGDISISSELYGSYLTMRMTESEDSETDDSYFRVFNNYADLEEYYNSSDEFFFYGKKFTLACASFDDEFMAQNDVLLLMISEPSSYITHSAASIRISDGEAVFDIERHIPKNAPQSSTQYHLIFIAPKGSFDALEDLEANVNITEVTEDKTDSALDAERYLYIYPEFWPFVHKTDANSSPTTVIDSIESYDELIEFYERYKSDYDLETEFLKYVGSLYDERMFEDYILLIVIAPCAENGEPLEVDELFVYNLEVYISVNNSSAAVVSETTPCYLLATAVSKKDLQGVNLSVFNISFN